MSIYYIVGNFFGDMILNCYFLLANILGFFAWFKHIEKNSKTIIKIKKATVSEKNKALIIFILTVSVTPFLYAYQKKYNYFKFTNL